MLLYCIIFMTTAVYLANGSIAQNDCPNNCPINSKEMLCGLNEKEVTYKVFPSQCAIDAYSTCHNVTYKTTPLEFCIKYDKTKKTGRREFYDDSCPVFCPKHYRPVCAAMKYMAYNYRTFVNGCHLDMLNCRGNEELTQTYIEVPLENCQRHLMKNIFKERVILSNIFDTRDYM